MACLPLPELPTIDIFPITIDPPPLPQLSGDLQFCCKLIEFNVAIPLPIPSLLIHPVIISVINGHIQTVQTLIDSLQFECPKE